MNDSILIPIEKTSIPRKYDRSSDKIPIPDLQDFLEPIASYTYTVPEPEIKLDVIKYEFDVMSNYKDHYLDK